MWYLIHPVNRARHATSAAGKESVMKRASPVALLLLTAGAPAWAQDAPAEARSPAADPAPAVTQAPESSAPAVISHARGARVSGPRPVAAQRTPYPAEGAGWGPRAGRYFLSRWAEDWSFLGKPDPKRRRDRFDALKYIPLTDEGAVYLSLSNEERVRFNYITSPGLRSGRDQDQFLLRNVVGADLHMGQYVRLYGELNSSQATGANPGVLNGNFRNDLIIQQAFAEVNGDVAGLKVGVMAGRQEFSDGPPNLVNLRPAPDVYTTFNGVRIYVHGKRARATAFDFKSTALGTGAFDDPIDRGERFRGINASFNPPPFATPLGEARLFIDPFVYRYENDARRWGAETAADRRNFYGARLWGTMGELTMDATVTRQTGRFADRDVSAFAAFSTFGYQLLRSGLQPRIGFHADWTSGGGYGSGTKKTFNPIFGSLPYFSWGNFVGPSNLAVLAPTLSITPLPRVRFNTEIEWLRRTNDRDAVYNGLTLPYARTQAVRGADIGRLYRADMAWAADPHVTVQLLFDYLDAGAVLNKADYHDSVYVGGAITFRL
ncbi:alginate export family protein [Sphingomonas parapaucimobilis]|uniref:alginate export family protein n=1 Tax=Sphingomonas parapaucimobilis TaxID=28213 RepID=UPI003219E8B0